MRLLPLLALLTAGFFAAVGPAAGQIRLRNEAPIRVGPALPDAGAPVVGAGEGPSAGIGEPTAAAQPVDGATFENGMAAYLEGDFQRTRAIWQPLALAGDIDAQRGLGTAYRDGVVTAPDMLAAAQWFRRAAAAGDSESQIFLAQMLRADGIIQNAIEAADWARQAAEQGDPRGQFLLAQMYRAGDGLAADPIRAAIWYERAAVAGSADAQLHLGLMFRDGLGVRANPDRANSLLAAAAAQGRQIPPASQAQPVQSARPVPERPPIQLRRQPAARTPAQSPVTANASDALIRVEPLGPPPLADGDTPAAADPAVVGVDRSAALPVELPANLPGNLPGGGDHTAGSVDAPAALPAGEIAIQPAAGPVAEVAAEQHRIGIGASDGVATRRRPRPQLGQQRAATQRAERQREGREEQRDEAPQTAGADDVAESTSNIVITVNSGGEVVVTRDEQPVEADALAAVESAEPEDLETADAGNIQTLAGEAAASIDEAPTQIARLSQPAVRPDVLRGARERTAAVAEDAIVRPDATVAPVPRVRPAASREAARPEIKPSVAAPVVEAPVVEAPALEAPALTPTSTEFFVGLSAYSVGDYDTARAVWEPLATGGAEMERAQAHVGLGWLAEGGDGGSPNYRAAAAHYQSAAGLESSEGYFRLAQMYADGRGIDLDPRRAARMLRQALDAALDREPGGLTTPRGRLLEVRPDSSSWLTRSLGRFSRKGSALSGAYLLFQQGAFQDAVAIWQGLAEKRVPAALFALARAADTGRGMALDQVAAINWLQQAAADGYGPAMYNLGVRLSQGRGVDADVRGAVAWYERAAEEGVPEAQYMLGMAHLNGIGIEENLRRARRLLEESLAGGVTDARLSLAAVYLRGGRENEDPLVSLGHLETAARNGSITAQAALGLLLARGIMIEPNMPLAVAWLERAGQGGNLDAQYNLGVLGVYGRTEDLAAGYLWLNEAAEGGLERARALRALVQNRLPREVVDQANPGGAATGSAPL